MVVCICCSLNSTDNNSITGVGFAPDFTWIKATANAYDHMLFDALRGTGSLRENLRSNTSSASDNDATNVKTLDSDGFTLGVGGYVNNSVTFASWNWKANGAGSANTDGSINSTVSANTTSGFSIVTWTGNSGNVGHGLGVKPAMIITKSLGASGGWYTTHKSLGAEMQDNYIFLNTSDANSTNNDIWGGEPTTSTFSVGSGLIGNTTHVAYCFAEKKGFSKFGSYTGNGNADGAFVYTGFKPAMVLFKQSSASGEKWYIYDNKRNAFNITNSVLFPNASDAESSATTGAPIDMLSNGFKLKGTDAAGNGSGSTYIYMAFAEEPLVSSNNIPATAR